MEVSYFLDWVTKNSGMNDTNTIDANDTGREVQVAYDPDRVRQGCAHMHPVKRVLENVPIPYNTWVGTQYKEEIAVTMVLPYPPMTTAVEDTQIKSSTTTLESKLGFSDCESSGCDDPLLSQNQSDVLMTQNIRFVNTHIVGPL